MALFYQIVFPHQAPNAETFLQQQIADSASGLQLIKESASQFAVRRDGELVASLVVTSESASLELSFGEYFYDTDWYIELGKSDGLMAMRFYVELLGRVLTAYDDDFLSIFNGELVVAKRENGQISLNKKSSIWNKSENMAILVNHPYNLVTYPVE